MLKKVSLMFLWSLWFFTVWAQVQSPAEFLGYDLGEQFTYHHRVIDYFEHVAETSPQVRLVPYGETYEGRPLVVSFITSEANMARLETLRLNNLYHTGLVEGTPTEEQLPIVWLAYNVHGNEAVSSEASMAMLYDLIMADTAQWLKDVIVVIDPCVNPDGRDRYTNWYRQAAATHINPHPESYEHHEPWPGGRFNHYLFDLNRDWCWQTQQESRHRIALYQQWMPHVLVDFHEMGPNSPYFFGPAAEPYHEVITSWQRRFQEKVGENNAHYFDQNSWLYFTREIFDLLYPSYGDTWSTYNGASGFTYEQGGSGSAGRALIVASEDTLTLSDRIAHHLTSGWATVETAHRNRAELLQEFNRYFETAQTTPEGKYKSYVIKIGEDPERVEALLGLLDGQQIQYGYPENGKEIYLGYDYKALTEKTFTLEKEDIVISAYQPQSRFVQVLMEPNTYLEDSVTYDLTAWALPYAYGVEAYAVEERIDLKKRSVTFPLREQQSTGRNPYAWAIRWKNAGDVRFLAALLREGIVARYASEPFSISNQEFDQGTLLITRTDNPNPKTNETVLQIAKTHNQELIPLKSGLVEKGKDMGSGSMRFVAPPRIALVNGPGVAPSAFGELWHFFERELEYPVDVLKTDYFSQVDLSVYDVLILASGSYRRFDDQILRYVRNGGKVIALERAISTFTASPGEEDAPTELGRALQEQEEETEEIDREEVVHQRYADRERYSLSDFVAGSIYRITLDPTHPLAFGEDSHIHVIKRNSTPYPYLSEEGSNVGTFQGDAHASGFTGYRLRKRLENTLAIGIEPVGSGTMIYFVDSPIFRQFWYSGKLLLGNAVFLVE